MSMLTIYLILRLIEMNYNMFKNKLVFNKLTLSYDKVNFFKYYKNYIRLIIIIFILGAVIVSLLSRVIRDDSNIYNSMRHKDWVMPSKQDIIIGGTVWKDSVFRDYTKRADLYLSMRAYKNSPIKGAMLSLAAYNAYDSTGILLPVELALAQAQWESGMGTKGRSPINNPYNVGEYDSGTILWFDNTFDGIQAYFYLMCTDYLSCKSLEELFYSFTNCQGYRYASGPYEEYIPIQYYYIKRLLTKQLQIKAELSLETNE